MELLYTELFCTASSTFMCHKSNHLSAAAVCAGEACKARGVQNLTMCGSLLLTFRSSHLGPAECTCQPRPSFSDAAAGAGQATSGEPTCAAIRSFFYEHPCRTQQQQQTHPDSPTSSNARPAAGDTAVGEIAGGGGEEEASFEEEVTTVSSCRPLLSECEASSDCRPILERFRSLCSSCPSLRQCALLHSQCTFILVFSVCVASLHRVTLVSQSDRCVHTAR